MNQTAEQEIAAYSRTLADEAQIYWQRHLPRFRYVIGLVEELHRVRRFRRVLDIGMGYQTMLLSRVLPDSRVDCLGIYEDPRFRPAGEPAFFRLDLNDAINPGVARAVCDQRYDLIVFMEVLEHLYTAPQQVLGYLASLLNERGVLLLTTPNAAWLKHRLKLLRGKNPFEMLRTDRSAMGHIREYTRHELAAILAQAGLRKLRLEARGLYRFDNVKDNCYSLLADATLPSLRRTLIAVYEKPATVSTPAGRG